MNVQEYAQKYGVEIKKDSCLGAIIPGWRFATDMPERNDYHAHLYDQGDGRFGLCLMYMTKREWSTAKRQLLAAGFTLSQDGDSEGILLFDPANVKQSRLALETACVATGASLEAA